MGHVHPHLAHRARPPAAAATPQTRRFARQTRCAAAPAPLRRHDSRHCTPAAQRHCRCRIAPARSPPTRGHEACPPVGCWDWLQRCLAATAGPAGAVPGAWAAGATGGAHVIVGARELVGCLVLRTYLILTKLRAGQHLGRVEPAPTGPQARRALGPPAPPHHACAAPRPTHHASRPNSSICCSVRGSMGCCAHCSTAAGHGRGARAGRTPSGSHGWEGGRAREQHVAIAPRTPT